MQKVACYCRTSTENQREEKTIDLQVESLTSFAIEKGYQVADWFKDDGVSGGLEQRPELARMMKFLEDNKDVEIILIYSLTRLARDLYIQEGLIREFTKLKKQIVSLTEPDLGSNDATRKLFRQVLGAFSEFEKAMITLRMKTGRDSAVINKKRWHGGPLYGFTSKDGALTVNQQEAEAIRTIYRLKRYKRMKLRQIANYLNENNIPTKRGASKWWPSTIRQILKNNTYKGKLIYKGKIYEGQHQKIIE